MSGGVEAEQPEPDSVEDDGQRSVELGLDACEIPGAVKRGQRLGTRVGAEEMVIVVVEAVVQPWTSQVATPASTMTKSAVSERLAQNLLGNRLELQV